MQKTQNKDPFNIQNAVIEYLQVKKTYEENNKRYSQRIINQIAIMKRTFITILF